MKYIAASFERSSHSAKESHIFKTHTNNNSRKFQQTLWSHLKPTNKSNIKLKSIQQKTTNLQPIQSIKNKTKQTKATSNNKIHQQSKTQRSSFRTPIPQPRPKPPFACVWRRRRSHAAWGPDGSWLQDVHPKAEERRKQRGKTSGAWIVLGWFGGFGCLSCFFEGDVLGSTRLCLDGGCLLHHLLTDAQLLRSSSCASPPIWGPMLLRHHPSHRNPLRQKSCCERAAQWVKLLGFLRLLEVAGLQARRWQLHCVGLKMNSWLSLCLLPLEMCLTSQTFGYRLHLMIFDEFLGRVGALRIHHAVTPESLVTSHAVALCLEGREVLEVVKVWFSLVFR